jgi:hypothetical protein
VEDNLAIIKEENIAICPRELQRQTRNRIIEKNHHREGQTTRRDNSTPQLREKELS